MPHIASTRPSRRSRVRFAVAVNLALVTGGLVGGPLHAQEVPQAVGGAEAAEVWRGAWPYVSAPGVSPPGSRVAAQQLCTNSTRGARCNPREFDGRLGDTLREELANRSGHPVVDVAAERVCPPMRSEATCRRSTYPALLYFAPVLRKADGSYVAEFLVQRAGKNEDGASGDDSILYTLVLRRTNGALVVVSAIYSIS